MKKLKHLRRLLLLAAILTLAAVSLLYPQHAESVARAFSLIIGAGI